MLIHPFKNQKLIFFFQRKKYPFKESNSYFRILKITRFKKKILSFNQFAIFSYESPYEEAKKRYYHTRRPPAEEMVFSAFLSLPAVLRTGSGPVIPKACVSYLSGLIKDASSSAQQATICQCLTRDFYLAAYIAFESPLLRTDSLLISPVKPPNSPFLRQVCFFFFFFFF